MNINEKIRYPKDEHLTILRVTESAYLIEGDRNATAYVVCGSQRALVVDTCFGYENYAEVVAFITDLPAVVVNTHAHGDHCGGNGYFEKAFIGEAELPQYQDPARPIVRAEARPRPVPWKSCARAIRSTSATVRSRPFISRGIRPARCAFWTGRNVFSTQETPF